MAVCEIYEHDWPAEISRDERCLKCGLLYREYTVEPHEEEY